MKAMKIIFIDFDGPLLSHRAKQHLRNQVSRNRSEIPPLPEPIDWTVVRAPPGSEKVRYFDDLAVALLLKLVAGHDARLVIASSWQKAGLANVQYILEENGISASYLHHAWKTGADSSIVTRAQQIEFWLNSAAQRGEAIEAYCALDDDLSVTSLAGGVMVPYSDGIRWSDFCSASAALGGGISVSDLESKDGILSANVTTGPLGESFVVAHGLRARRIALGPIQRHFGPAPRGCLRLQHSEYQLVRLGGTQNAGAFVVKYVR